MKYMELKQQVVSLELAKKLKEMGVKQESLWYWEVNKMEGINPEIVLSKDRGREYEYDDFSQHYYSAFTVAELGELLPSDIVSGRTPNSIAKGYDHWACLDFIEFGAAAYHHDDDRRKKPEFIEDTEANARAKMLIYLLENNLITLNH